MSAVRPRTAALTLACLIALAVAGDLLWMPNQVNDSLGEILDAHDYPTVSAAFTTGAQNLAYLRPVRLAQIKVLYEAARGEHFWLVYRGFHALLLLTAVLLFVRALRVTTVVDAGAAAFALVVLTGLHTFRGMVQESFPINHFLEIVVFCLLTLNLARSRGGMWTDIAAAFTFVVAALTLESGLLVWVVAATAWAVGWRGISRRGLVAMTVLLAAYVCVRFLFLSTGLPTLTERSSGYLFAVLDPPELEARFAAQPLLFYAYNVVTSAVSVLLSEPRAGVFAATHAWMNGEVLPRVWIPLLTSGATTALVAWAAIRSSWRVRSIDDGGRLLAIFAAVLVANALLSYSYTKDEIMSIAGAFYAMAAFAALRETLIRLSHMRRGAAAALSVILVVLCVGWTVRAAGLHYLLRSQAFKHQNDWADLPYAWQRSGRWPTDPSAQDVVLTLWNDAVAMRLPNVREGVPRWMGGVWED